jgi:hypothetical protein
VALLAIALPGVSLAAAPAPPAFQIEKISVEGLRHGSPGIVVAASLLHAGTAYTELELRAAVYRVERLPFVLAADFSLRKGSVRNTFELVITVTQTSDFFLSADLSGPVFTGDSHLTPQATAGWRTFVGGYGEVVAGLGSPDLNGGRLTYQLSYTNHNLLEHSLVGTVTLGYTRPEGDDPGPTTSVGARLIAPLGGDHALRLEYEWSRASGSRRSSLFGMNSEQVNEFDAGTLDWVFDSTNDPFTPTSGTRAVAGATLARSRYIWDCQVGPCFAERSDMKVDRRELHLDAARFFSTGRHQAIGIGGAYRHETQEGYLKHEGVATSSTDEKWTISYRHSEASLRASYTVALWRPQARETFNQWWLEARLEVRRSQDSSLDFGGPSNTRSHWESDEGIAKVALAWRSRWGTVRLGASYSKTLGSRTW